MDKVLYIHLLCRALLVYWENVFNLLCKSNLRVSYCHLRVSFNSVFMIQIRVSEGLKSPLHKIRL